MKRWPPRSRHTREEALPQISSYQHNRRRTLSIHIWQRGHTSARNLLLWNRKSYLDLMLWRTITYDDSLFEGQTQWVVFREGLEPGVNSLDDKCLVTRCRQYKVDARCWCQTMIPRMEVPRIGWWYPIDRPSFTGGPITASLYTVESIDGDTRRNNIIQRVRDLVIDRGIG